MTGGPQDGRNLLRRAARDGRLAGRWEACAGPAEAARHLLDHLDAAVLACRLRVETGDRALVLTAAARRLVALSVPGPDTADAGAPVDRPLTAEDAAAVAAVLRATLAGATRVRVLHLPPESPVDPAATGLSVAALAAALDLPPPDPAPDDGFEAGLAALGAGLRAAVLIEGDDLLPLAGDPAATGSLAEEALALLDRLLVPAFPLRTSFETDGALTFAAAGAGRHWLLAGRHGRFLLAEMAGDDAAATLGRWRAATTAA